MGYRKSGLSALTVACFFSAGLVWAQGSFDEGSFEGGSFGEEPSAPDSTPANGSGDGFDEGSFDVPANEGQPPGPGVAVDDSPGSGDFDAGSFPDDDTSTPGVTPGADVAQPERPTEPNPGLQIDPQIFAFEMRDFGVPPQGQLRQGQFHAPTPTALPGGTVVSTQELATAMNSGTQMIVIDVLGGNYGLPNAFTAPALASPGHFRDRTQQQAHGWLQQISGGNLSVPVVVYCSDPMCWLSYNGALRAVAAGYQNVFWYRGGVQAWQMAGLPMYPTGF